MVVAVGTRALLTGVACVLAGVAVGACASSPSTSPQAAKTPAATTPAATSPSAKATAPASPATTASQGPAVVASRRHLPGVIYDCSAGAPLAQKSAPQPARIGLTCTNDSIGITDLLWSSWTATGATGTGLVWANDCKPSCADGKLSYYQAAVTLSGVKDTTTNGALFSRVNVTYQTAHASAPALDDYPLPMPPK